MYNMALPCNVLINLLCTLYIFWRFLVQLGYGLGHVLNDLCASMWFTYLLLFYHKVNTIVSFSFAYDKAKKKPLFSEKYI